MRRTIVIVLAAAALGATGGCGGKFDLPTESRVGREIPADQSYQMVATWTGMTDVRDILLTQGAGTQLFVLFNHGGMGTASRGEVKSYARLRATGAQTPIGGIDFLSLFNPIALCSGGDGIASANNRVFVLDAGDTCLARLNPSSGMCDTTNGFDTRITDLGSYWRVREYGLLGGDTISTFTDTTMAAVTGVAADAQGRVYVGGLAIILVPDQADPRILTRTFRWGIYRYIRGPRYPGITPADRRLPGANWHRDSLWTVGEGTGIGTVMQPEGIFWSAAGGNALYVTDFQKNWVQKLSVTSTSTGLYQLDGTQSGGVFNGPRDLTVDLQGFTYIADTGTQRVLRYDTDGAYVQDVNIENDAFGQALTNPLAVAADDSLVFVGDPALGEVIRYKRRQ